MLRDKKRLIICIWFLSVRSARSSLRAPPPFMWAPSRGWTVDGTEPDEADLEVARCIFDEPGTPPRRALRSRRGARCLFLMPI